MFRFFIIVSLVYCCVHAGTLSQHRFSMDGRILGGRNATIEDVPYQVSILVYGEHKCGGSILTDRWVLTTARCIEYVIPITLQVRVNSSLYNDGGVIYNLYKLIVHPKRGFSYYDHDYDYGLVQLAKPLEFGRGVQPIGLPEQGKELTAGTVVQVTGFGIISNEWIYPVVLQIVELPIVSQTACNVSYNEEITDRMLCAADQVGAKDSCPGDTGGPLVAADGKVYGLVSYEPKCTEKGRAGVYAKVSDQVNWIRTVIGL